MPGILPMKVIKLGTAASERIAQACDRCRSKKIKCDGLAPACSQCTTVRFECKTSDKLSRRAFPRGYTESLEERVRSLELEIRELKDLLDEKDEKIDIISKLYSPQAISQSRRSSASPPSNKEPAIRRPSVQVEQRDLFKVFHAPLLQVSPSGSDAHYTGSSSLRAFIDTFRQRVQESARSCADFDTNQLVPTCTDALPSCSLAVSRQDFTVAPPRVLSDQMVNTFFQEWAPLFPVLHRPTFLKTYQQYVNDAGSVEDTRDIAQLNLVFCIGAFARESHVSTDTARCEQHWRSALTTFDMETSLARLQCLILAQLYAIQRADWNDLYQFKSVAVGIALRLGLNVSQKRFVMGALSAETRKKVLWTLYTIDCFSAASMGLPRMLKSESIQCEYPCDVDDEYVTETGFQPTLPGEYTRLSSSIALFRASRVLAKVLDETYTASESQELSLQGISALEEDLEAWYNNLAPHLKLEFLQDKPSTHVISSRCPLLSLTYQYIRILIHRHAVCADIGAKAASSVVALASSSKRVVQILQLLKERNFSLSHCINKDELLITAGFGLFYQNLELDEACKLFKDTSKLIGSIVGMLERDGKHSADALVRIERAFLPAARSAEHVDSPPIESSTDLVRRTSAELATHKQLQGIANRYTLVVNKDRLSRRTSHASIDAVACAPGAAQSPDLQDNRRAMHFVIPCSNSSSFPSPAERTFSSWSSSKRVSQSPFPSAAIPQVGKLNLDYFSFGHTPDPDPEREIKTDPPSGSSDWTKLMNSLGEIHDGQATKTSSNLSLHDEAYSPAENTCPAPPSISSTHEPLWDNDFWDLAASTSNVAASNSSSIPSMTRSNFSLSEEDILEPLETTDNLHVGKNLPKSYSIPNTPLSGVFDFTKDVFW